MFNLMYISDAVCWVYAIIGRVIMLVEFENFGICRYRLNI